MFSLAGLFAPLAVYALILVLHLAVPARWADGYVRDAGTGVPLRYRLNGLRVLVVTMGLYVGLGASGVLPWAFLWTHRVSSAAGACVLGLAFTFAIVLPFPRRGGLLADLYLGRRDNPRWAHGRVDAKMLLYLVGAVMLELNLLSFAAHEAEVNGGRPAPGVFLYVALFTFFVSEYLFFEEVHLYTYDFFAERVGFKLGWGCLAFYPFFYGVGLWSAARYPDPYPGTPWLVLAGLVFAGGWALSRGANLQKFLFKTQPTKKLCGVLAPASVGDGQRKLLCNGFWGLSRHINYLGEILMAVGLTLALGRPFDPWPWLYPLYYLALLLPRQADDDRRCAAKYGALWTEYCRRVPYRIVPGLY